MKMNKLLLIVFAGLLLVSGCRPYNVPVFVDVKPNETAFVIPVTGDLNQQKQFDSIEMLNKAKVSAKRIQVPRTWVSTGYLWRSGEYKNDIMVIKVDRTPITRYFEVDNKESKKDADAIWVESADSVGFSMGFNVTAMIQEKDTVLFLYRYQATSLATVVDTEIRSRIQMKAAEFSARYKLDQLRELKNEMVISIKDDLIPFFSERGITITTVGQSGGMTYENVDIQKSIDTTFINQQEKVNAAALLAAQKDKNATIEMAALATAEKNRREAQGQADARIMIAKADAAAIEIVAKSAAEAASNPTFIKLKELEIEAARVKTWNGQYPQFLLSGQSTPPMLINVPTSK